MTIQVTSRLLEKYHQGECTPEELHAITQWLSAADDVESLPAVSEEAAFLSSAWEAVEAGMYTTAVPARRYRMPSWAAVAAGIMIVAGLLAWWYTPGKEKAVQVAGGMTRELDELRLALPVYADAVVHSNSRNISFTGDLQVTNTSGSDQRYTFTYMAAGKPAVERAVLLKKGKKYIIGYSAYKHAAILVFTANRFNTLPPGIHI